MDISSFFKNNFNVILFAGIVFVFILIIVVGFSAIHIQQQKTELEIHDELFTIANMKSASISNWFHERQADAYVAMKSQILFEFLKNQNNPGEYDITRSDMITWIQSLISNYYYSGIILSDNNGNVLIAEPHNATMSRVIMNNTLKKVLNSTDPVFTDLFLNPESKKISMEFWVPIRDRINNNSLGILIFQIDPEEYLYPLIQSWPTTSVTAESLITRPMGDSVLFLNNLKYVPDSALNYKVPITEKNVPAVMAAYGYKGIVKGVDYRGIPVVASITNINRTPWNLIAKIDQNEIYTPFSQFTRLTIGGIVLLLFIAGFVFLFIWKTREKEYFLHEIHQKDHELYLADRIRLIMQQANDAILIMNNDWYIIEVNEKAVELYGFTPEEFRNKTLFDLRSESAKQKIEEDLKNLEDSERIILETEHQKKDGTTFFIESSARILTVNGVITKQSIIRDISERKKYESDLLEKNIELQTMNEEITASYEELASQEEEIRDQMEMLRQSEIQLSEIQIRLNNAQKAGHVGVWEYYVSSQKVWGSDETFRIFGYSFTKEMEKDIEELLACIPDRDRVYSAILATIDEDIPFNMEFLIHPLDGSGDRVVSSIASLDRDDAGIPIKLAGIIQDITEKRTFEEEIRQYQERLSALFNSPLLGILFGDIYGSIRQVNDAFLQIIGYSREDFFSKNTGWKDITPDEFLTQDEQKIAQARDTGSCYPYEKQYIRKDGSRIWVLIGYILIGPTREDYVAFILDISEKKRNEDVISTMNQTLEERVKERTNKLISINEELQLEIEERVGAEKKLQEILSILSATLESTEDGIFVVNRAGKVTIYNKKFVEMWQIPDTVIRSKDEKNIFCEIRGKVSDPEEFCKKIDGIKDEPDLETSDVITLLDKRTFEQYSKPQRIEYTTAGRVWSFRDVTRKKEMELQIDKSLREKEILLKEIHHRVKNNMQVVSSLLFMQSRLSNDENLKEILRESQNRVKSIALVHEELYQSMDLDRIDYNRYLRKISRNIFDTYKVNTSRIAMKLSEKTVFLNISKAVPCSLIINELISNSLKHAFPNNLKGRIIISFALDNGCYHLSYEDNGIGIPQSLINETPQTLGFELIKGLVKQLSGTIKITVVGGTRYDIEFPE